MHIVSSGWFGWSVLWLCPILWRLFRALVLKNSALHGQGSIRLWLGSALALAASSALEAMARGGDGIGFGRMIAGGATGLVGTVAGTLLLLGLLGLAARWIFLARAPAPAASAEWRAAVPMADAVARSTLPASDPDPVRTPIRGKTPRRLPSWSLPPPPANDKTNRYARFTLPRRTRPGQARASNEWATVESLRPTPAMQARAASMEATTKASVPSRPGGRTEAGQTRIIRAPMSQVRPATQAKPAALAETGTPGLMRPEAAAATPLSPLPQPQPQPQSEAARMPAAQAGATESAAAATPVTVTGTGGGEPGMAAWAPVESPVPQAVSVPHPIFGDEEGAAPQLSAALASLAKGTSGTSGTTAENGAAVTTMTTVSHIAAPGLPVETVRPLYEIAPPARATTTPPLAQHDMTDRFEFQPSHGIDVELPGLDLLDAATRAVVSVAPARLAETGQLIEQRLKEFKVPVSVLGAFAGPVITRFEVEPATGVRGAQIVGLMKDLARALGLTSIRVVETIPGKTCMGLELPNPQRQTIQLSEILNALAYRQSASFLTLALGKDITGVPVVTDLARAPHMLVAGTTGSGKSVAINAMILSLLYKSTPADVRLIMIDPKMLELSVYDGIPHLLAPVVTDMKHAANALNWCVGEMDRRYRLMSALGVRNLAGYNQKIRDAAAVERKIPNPFSLTPDAPEPLSTLPLIVVVIDELADLMMVAGKKIEELIARLAQKARAAGIHLILATQRPSVDVITGLIKANIPTRVAFQVSSKIDSRTVLDQMGAEALLGHGDMLFLPPGSGYPQRVHGAFVSDQEVHRVVEFLKQFGEPEYVEAILAGAPVEEAAADGLAPEGNAEADPLYDEAVAFVVRTRRASISSVQRQFRIGYNRAARLVEQMEVAGILSPMATNGSRDVLAPSHE